ncbi:hypothetical protein F0562_021716 [Nyssa sinensis]|uniref:GTP cyclohydrolase 1 n=1 Tax=Nyssa sinensis TaxID=561372 RepID=A0A5J5BLJ0_9ASTE|nr:hypothetical protein F0562_021716 [Nyssa sinensis]
MVSCTLDTLVLKEFDPIGKPLLQSIVHFHGFKLQVQERLTRQIAETVSSVLGGDIMVVVEANHTCMIARGITGTIHKQQILWASWIGVLFAVAGDPVESEMV